MATRQDGPARQGALVRCLGSARVGRVGDVVSDTTILRPRVAARSATTSMTSVLARMIAPVAPPRCAPTALHPARMGRRDSFGSAVVRPHHALAPAAVGQLE